MKRNRLKLILVASVTILASTQSKAQLVGDRAFMLGDYVEVGINENGYEGAALEDSIATHYRGFTGKLGFVANPQADGWIDYDGDFYLPGSPENGFGVTYTLLGATYNRGNNAVGIAGIPGEITAVTDNVDSTLVTWVGSIDDLEMTIIYELKKDEHFYTTTMGVTNLGLETFTDLYYYRTLDPDNNQDLGWGFPTQNTIESQAGMSDDSVRVSAISEGDWVSEMIFHAYGENWRGYYGGFSNRDGDAMWNGTGGLVTTEGATLYGDQAIGISYHIASLPPGKAGSEVFSFATVFNRVEFFTAEVDDSGIDQNFIDFRLYPNPTETNQITIDIEGQFTYSIVDMKGMEVTAGNGNNLTHIDLNSIEKGIYFITILQENKMSTQKLILN